MENGETSSVLTEVPENLKTLCLLLTKTFYGLHSYVLLDYVQRLGCVKEDRLRDILKLDPRYLRQLIVTLKERTIAEENEGRSRKVNYYHVNYKAILNVTKYKIDHMRQKLEHKEHAHVQKSSYVCSQCRRHYEALDVATIYNPESQEMICWQCNGRVVQDETAGPSEETRSSLAKFNEDMGGIFSMLQQMDGIRFSRQILEPPITIIHEEPKEQEGKGALQVGARMFSNAEKTRSDLYGNGIMVSIGEKQEIQVESKEKVPWLQHSTHEEGQPPGGEDPTNGISGISLAEEERQASTPSFLAPLLGEAATADIWSLLVQVEGQKEGPAEALSPTRTAPARESVDEPPAAEARENGAADLPQAPNSQNGSEEEPVRVQVRGQPVPLQDMTQQLVDSMSAAERQAYIDLVASSVFF